VAAAEVDGDIDREVAEGGGEERLRDENDVERERGVGRFEELCIGVVVTGEEEEGKTAR
jgi:hypothetical protein